MNNKSVWEFYCHQNRTIPLAEIKGETFSFENRLQSQKQAIDITGITIEIGDINQNIIAYNSRREDNLFELETLEDFKSPVFPKPKTSNLFNNKRLLLLGGDHDDKKELARYFAINLLEKEGQSKVKVFILYDITPQHLNQSLNLSLIHEYVQSGDNYVIAVTDTPLSSWNNDDRLHFGYELQRNNPNLYETNDLVESLLQRLDGEIKANLTDPKSIIQKGIIANELQTFASILRCARGINNLKDRETNTSEQIEQIFKNARDRSGSLEKWYDGLGEKDQLIALALTFFDGFLEDQFFEALYELVVKARSFRHKDLESADKTDLKNLANHFTFDEKKYPQKLNDFKFVRPKLETTEIEVRSIHIRSDERLIFFKIAWEKYRRQILNALPVIINLITESAENVPTNLALYGSPLHRSKLRDVLVQTLSDLGLVPGAISAVRDALFQLATDERFELKEVAAKVVENWYSFFRAELLADKKREDIQGEKESLGTLQLFYGRAMDVGRDTQKGREYQDNVIATIAMAVTRIAAYDPPDELSEELCDWLKELANHDSPIVANYLGYNTLYNLVLQHMGNNLSETLKEITQLNQLLNDPIAASLARAYKEDEYTTKVWETLKSWYQECAQNWKVQTINIDSHQRLLRTVATTYGLIQFHKIEENNPPKVEKSDALKITKTLKYLHIILIKEEQPFVSQSATIAIVNLSNQYFKQVEIELNMVGKGLSDDRRSQVIEILKKVYQGKTKVDNTSFYPEFLFRTVGLSRNKNQNNKPIVQDTIENLFQILRQEQSHFINEVITVSIRLLANSYFEDFISKLEVVASQCSKSQRQEIINIMIEIYLDQRSTQKGGDGEVEIKGCKYPTWTSSKRSLTDIETVMSDWFNNYKNPQKQQEIAILASLKFVCTLGMLDPASFSTGLIKDLEKYAPKCSNELREEIVENLKEIYRDQRERIQQVSPDQETDIEKIVIYWLKNDNNLAIKQIAMRASIEFEGV
jgi:hypothetical protein